MSRSKSTVVEIPLAELVMDMSLYPRHAVDGKNVQALVDALVSGADLPPIVADAEGKRIIDGWHRYRAHKRLYGAECKVKVELIRYADEGEMMFDAVARNARHGRALDTVDRTRSVFMLRAHNLSDERIAVALNTTTKRIEKLSIRVAEAPRGVAESVIPGTSMVALKRSVRHLDGEKLTKAQASAHRMMPGTSFVLIAKQLRTAIESGLCDLDNPALVEELRLLSDALRGHSL